MLPAWFTRILFIKILCNRATNIVDTWAWTVVICANNNISAWCFPRSFCEGYGNIKIRTPVTDELFSDLALHWTLDYMRFTNKARQIRLWAASHYGLRHLPYHGSRPSNSRALITAGEYCKEGLSYHVYTYVSYDVSAG